MNTFLSRRAGITLSFVTALLGCASSAGTTDAAADTTLTDVPRTDALADAPIDAPADAPIDVPVDVAPLPTAGCFAGPITLGTTVVPAGQRAHPRAIALVARDDGWLAFYEDNVQGPRVAFLEMDGTVRATGDYYASGQGAIDDGGSVVLTSSFEQTRLDVSSTAITRVYARLGIPGIRSITKRAPGAYRALSVREGDPRLWLTDLVFDNSSATGFAAREGVVPIPNELLYAATSFVAGDSLLLVAQPTGDSWRIVLLQLDTSALGSQTPIPTTVVSDTTFAQTRSEGFPRVTNDLRHLVVLRSSLDGSGTEVLPIAPATGTVRFDALPHQTFETEGRLSFLFPDRFVAVRRSDFAPLAELPYAGSQPVAAHRGNRAAVLSAINAGSMEARLELRCTAVPASP